MYAKRKIKRRKENMNATKSQNSPSIDAKRMNKEKQIEKNPTVSRKYLQIAIEYQQKPIQHLLLNMISQKMIANINGISMCFVRECCTGFLAILIALVLSQRRGTFSKVRP